MASDEEIKKAFYEYGKYLAANMGEGVNADDDDEIEEAWDEVSGTSMCYTEILEEVADKVEAGLGGQFAELKTRLKLSAEMERGWTDGIKGA